MGEAKRKRTLKELADGMEEIRAEGQGVWRMEIYGPEAIPALLVNSFQGDKHATRTMQVVSNMIAGIARAPAHDRVLCLLCDTALSQAEWPRAIVMLYAQRDDPKQTVVNGICAACYARYPSAEALSSPVTDYYRRNMISDLRVLPPIIEPGGTA